MLSQKLRTRNYAHFELFWFVWTVYLAIFDEIWWFFFSLCKKRCPSVIWQKISLKQHNTVTNAVKIEIAFWKLWLANYLTLSTKSYIIEALKAQYKCFGDIYHRLLCLNSTWNVFDENRHKSMKSKCESNFFLVVNFLKQNTFLNFLLLV